MIQPKNSKQSGNIALITLLIVMAVTLTIGISMYSMSLINVKMAFGDQQLKQALFIAESCLEEAYLQLKLDPLYTSSSITLPNGTCSITITPNGSERVIIVESEKNNYYRSIETSVTLGYFSVSQNYWKEL